MNPYKIIPFCVFFVFGDDAPEGSASPIFNSLRPYRFSNTITEKETELIVSSRLTKKSTVKRSVPWGKLVFDRDIWLFSISWFLSTFACKSLSDSPIIFTEYFSFCCTVSSTSLVSIFNICRFGSRDESWNNGKLCWYVWRFWLFYCGWQIKIGFKT